MTAFMEWSESFAEAPAGIIDIDSQLYLYTLRVRIAGGRMRTVEYFCEQPQSPEAHELLRWYCRQQAMHTLHDQGVVVA